MTEFERYDTPETAWRYNTLLIRTIERYTRLMRELEEVEKELDDLLANPPKEQE